MIVRGSASVSLVAAAVPVWPVRRYPWLVGLVSMTGSFPEQPVQTEGFGLRGNHRRTDAERTDVASVRDPSRAAAADRDARSEALGSRFGRCPLDFLLIPLILFVAFVRWISGRLNFWMEWKDMPERWLVKAVDDASSITWTWRCRRRGAVKEVVAGLSSGVTPSELVVGGSVAMQETASA